MLARPNGKSIGFIANNPLFKGGALDAEACQNGVGEHLPHNWLTTY